MNKDTALCKPVISVVVAVYNGDKTLNRCIESVTNQTYSNVELIIIDGGSTDQTVNIIKENEDRITYWESKSDRGIYHAWNKALDHVSGKWVIFLGADDYLWDRDVFKNVCDSLCKQGQEHKLIYCKVALVDSKSKVIKVAGDDWEKLSKYADQEMTLPHQGLFHHVSIFKNEKFDENFKIAGDFDLVLRTLQTTRPFFISSTIVSAMTMGGVSNSPVGTFKCLKEFSKVRGKHGVETDYYKLTKSYLKAAWLYLLYMVHKSGRTHDN